MNFSPVIVRELRTVVRQPGCWWLRSLTAFVAGCKGCEMLARYSFAPGPWMTGPALLNELVWLAFLAALLMGLVTANSINRERREGTLGLLLLTDLSPAQIVHGKLLASGLQSFFALLGFVPALMIPVLAGGVSGTAVVLAACGLANTLFVSLAAGLWMSALFRERLHGMAATLALVGVLAFGAELAAKAFLDPLAAPLFRLFGLAGWTTVLIPGWFFALPFPVMSVVVTHGLGWLFLRQAAVTLARNWRDAPHEHFRKPEPADDWSPLVAARAPAAVPVSWLTDPRPWDADPVRWRMRRMASAEGFVWLAVGLSFIAQFGLLGSTFNADAGSGELWGVWSLAGMVGMVSTGGLLAWAGARFFQDARRRQDLELLLTTPVGGRDILASQWRELRSQLAWPLGLVLALAMPAGIALLYAGWQGWSEETRLLLPPFLIALNVALEPLALCWTGMKCGLHDRNLLIAVVHTVGIVQLVPLTLATVLSLSWISLANTLGPEAGLNSVMSASLPVLAFLLVKNLVFIGWSRFRLRRDLRLDATSADENHDQGVVVGVGQASRLSPSLLPSFTRR